MKIKFESRNPQGFTLIEILIVAGIIGLLAAIAIPNVLRSGNTARLNDIYANLRVVSDAKEQWALDNGKPPGEPTDMISLSGYFLHGVTPVVQEEYIPNPLGTAAYAQLPGGVGLPPYAPGDAIPAR